MGHQADLLQDKIRTERTMLMWIYVLERIKDSPQWPAGTVIHAHRRCKGWRVVDKYWDGHRGGGLR